jgi:hypothetical protein
LQLVVKHLLVVAVRAFSGKESNHATPREISLDYLFDGVFLFRRVLGGASE